jgi:hypothetical protein
MDRRDVSTAEIIVEIEHMQFTLDMYERFDRNNRLTRYTVIVYLSSEDAQMQVRSIYDCSSQDLTAAVENAMSFCSNYAISRRKMREAVQSVIDKLKNREV